MCLCHLKSIFLTKGSSSIGTAGYTFKIISLGLETKRKGKGEGDGGDDGDGGEDGDDSGNGGDGEDGDDGGENGDDVGDGEDGGDGDGRSWCCPHPPRTASIG